MKKPLGMSVAALMSGSLDDKLREVLGEDALKRLTEAAMVMSTPGSDRTGLHPSPRLRARRQAGHQQCSEPELPKAFMHQMTCDLENYRHLSKQDRPPISDLWGSTTHTDPVYAKSV